MRSDARHPPVQRLSVQDCIPTVRILALLMTLAKCASYVERPQNQSVATAMELVVKNTISSWNKSPYGKYYCCGNLRCCFAGDQEAALPNHVLGRTNHQFDGSVRKIETHQQFSYKLLQP